MPKPEETKAAVVVLMIMTGVTALWTPSVSWRWAMCSPRT